ncbi:O-antigen polymerase [Pseudoalteromonas sp. PAB 2.2]|uniref:O-antigen polymerase n=1 Tax=Pseudoalteromonas sp. PAB 2.2 TaxID=1841508 RepID=UPI00094FDAF9|nr:O-antigen polymerase [Pseudoalteromonas sp. PAB 2.2]
MFSIVLWFIIIAVGATLYIWRFRRLVTPMSFVFTLWMSLFFILLSGITVFPRLSFLSFSMISLALLSFVIGSVSVSSVNVAMSRDIFTKVERSKLFLLIVLSTPLILYSVYFLVSKLLSIGLEGYLMETKWGGEQINIFSGSLGYSIVTVFLKGFIYASFFYSLSVYFLLKEKKYLYISTFLILSYSIVLFSRVEMLVCFFSVFVALFLVKEVTIKLFFKVFLFLVVAISFMVFFSYIRSGNTLSLGEVFLKYLVYYHLYGITIFGLVVDSKIVVEGIDTSYGLLTLPILSFFPEHIISFVQGERFLSPATEARGLMQQEVLITFTDGTYIKTNAFFTSLYLFYKDFGVLGVMLFPLLYGYFFSRSYLEWLKSKSPIDMAFVIFWSYTGYTALFFPPQIAEFYWFCFLSLLFIKYRFKRIVK